MKIRNIVCKECHFCIEEHAITNRSWFNIIIVFVVTCEEFSELLEKWIELRFAE